MTEGRAIPYPTWGGAPLAMICRGCWHGRCLTCAFLKDLQIPLPATLDEQAEIVCILDALDQVAARHHANPTRVAIAWLIARPGVTAPIATTAMSAPGSGGAYQ